MKEKQSKIGKKYFIELYKDKSKYNEWYKNRYGYYPEDRPLEYCIDWKVVSNFCRDRDRNICQICGCNSNGKKHHVHHIDGNKMNCNPINGITLCLSCHSSIHTKKYNQAEPEERIRMFWQDIMVQFDPEIPKEDPEKTPEKNPAKSGNKNGNGGGCFIQAL